MPIRKSSSPRIKFQFVSDLHLETPGDSEEFFISAVAPYLILGGDIGRLSSCERYLAFLGRQCSSFERVFLVLGNHEFFGLSREEGLNKALSLEQESAL